MSPDPIDPLAPSGRAVLAGIILAGVVLATALLAGCVLRPEGLDDEAERASQAGAPFRQPWEQRDLPELPASPAWAEVIERVQLADGDVEAAWHDWNAAIERVSVEAGWPNTNLALNLAVALEGGMSLWDRTVIGLGFDPMEMLDLPSRRAQAGRVALAEAVAAGRRFDAARLGARRQAQEALLDYALWAERLAIADEWHQLLAADVASTTARVAGGAPQQDILQASIARDLSRNELLALQAEGPALASRLDALLGRQPVAALQPPALPPPREIPDDATLLSAGVDGNPGLAALASDAGARQERLRAAELRYLPAAAPSFSTGGSAPDTIGLMVSVPITLPALDAAVAQARSELAAAQAVARQAGLDAAARYVSSLSALRAAERQADVLQQSVLPAAGQLARGVEAAYASGAAGFAEIVAARRVALDSRAMLAEARVERERQLAILEELAGRDLDLTAFPPAAIPPAALPSAAFPSGGSP